MSIAFIPLFRETNDSVVSSAARTSYDAHTIADLDHSATVSAKHLAEAVQYRGLDRNYWT